MQMNGSDILVECLLEQGVDTVFGYPGGSVLNIYDALYMYSDRIRHVLTAHEQGASHAADGYARATGKVGVCIATSGPGATNLVTGIATAYMDSIPMVAVTGNVAVPLLGRDSFQEVDITGITMPVTKYNFIVKRVEDLADTVRKAFIIAKSGRPGPVLVDIPKGAGEKIYTEDLRPYEQEIKGRDLLMIRTGFSRVRAENPQVYAQNGPALCSDAAKYLMENYADQLKAVALDFISLASYSDCVDGDLSHQYLCGKFHPGHICIIEDVNMEGLSQEQLVYAEALPLFLEGVDSSPVTMWVKLQTDRQDGRQ